MLDRIVTGRVEKPPKLLIWGPPAVGKSTFAAGAEDAIFIEAEDRTGHLDVARLPVKSWEEVFEAIKAVATAEGRPYKTIVFDTIDAMELLLFEFLARDAGESSHEDIGGGWFKFRTPMLKQLKRFVNQLDRLTHKGFQVVILAHAQTKSYQPPGGGEKYDRFVLKMDAAGGDYIMENMDLVGHAKFKVYVNKSKDKTTKARAITSGERELAFAFDPVHPTKRGIPCAESCKLDWGAFQEALKVDD